METQLFTAQCTLVQSAVLRSHVVRQSVRLSVTLVVCDHIGWKSWKLIARAISPTWSHKAIYVLPGEHREILGRQEVGYGKVALWRTKAAISLKRVTIEEKWTAYRNSQTLFRTVSSPTPYGLPFPKIGGSQPPLKSAI